MTHLMITSSVSSLVPLETAQLADLWGNCQPYTLPPLRLVSHCVCVWQPGLSTSCVMCQWKGCVWGRGRRPKRLVNRKGLEKSSGGTDTLKALISQKSSERHLIQFCWYLLCGIPTCYGCNIKYSLVHMFPAWSLFPSSFWVCSRSFRSQYLIGGSWSEGVSLEG